MYVYVYVCLCHCSTQRERQIQLTAHNVNNITAIREPPAAEQTTRKKHAVIFPFLGLDCLARPQARKLRTRKFGVSAQTDHQRHMHAHSKHCQHPFILPPSRVQTTTLKAGPVTALSADMKSAHLLRMALPDSAWSILRPRDPRPSMCRSELSTTATL